MAILFFFIGRVLNKTGPPNARILTVLFKDKEGIQQQLDLRLYEASGQAIAMTDHCYLFSGKAILQEGLPPKVSLSSPPHLTFYA
jgi:hypothetical protein